MHLSVYVEGVGAATRVSIGTKQSDLTPLCSATDDRRASKYYVNYPPPPTRHPSVVNPILLLSPHKLCTHHGTQPSCVTSGHTAYSSQVCRPLGAVCKPDLLVVRQHYALHTVGLSVCLSVRTQSSRYQVEVKVQGHVYTRLDNGQSALDKYVHVQL